MAFFRVAPARGNLRISVFIDVLWVTMPMRLSERSKGINAWPGAATAAADVLLRERYDWYDTQISPMATHSLHIIVRDLASALSYIVPLLDIDGRPRLRLTRGVGVVVVVQSAEPCMYRSGHCEPI